MTENEKRIGMAAGALAVGGILLAALNSKARARFKGFASRGRGYFRAARVRFKSWRSNRSRR